MNRIYKHLSDDTLKELYVAIKRAEDELMKKAPREGMLDWYITHDYGAQNSVVMQGIWLEMNERGLLDY